MVAEVEGQKLIKTEHWNKGKNEQVKKKQGEMRKINNENYERKKWTNIGKNNLSGHAINI